MIFFADSHGNKMQTFLLFDLKSIHKYRQMIYFPCYSPVNFSISLIIILKYIVMWTR